MFENFQLKQLVIFTLINLVYVIMNCTKTILQIKGSRRQSCIMSAITYGFYCIVLKQITQVDYFTSIVGTMISNIIGDYLGRTLSTFIIKRPIICYKFTLPKQLPEMQNIINDLDERDKQYQLGYNWGEVQKKDKEYYKFTVYTHTREHDKMIEEFLKKYNINKYHKEDYVE